MQKYGGNPLLANTIAYYPLVTNSNDVVNGYNGSDTSISYNSDAGDFQDTADFTASTSAKIEVADADAFSFGNGTSDSPFSISLRFRYVSLGGQLVCKFGNPSTTLREWFVYLVSGNITLRLRLQDQSTGGYRDISFTLSPVVDTLYWVVFTYDGTTGHAYLNGTDQLATTGDTGSYTAMENLSAPVTFGKNPASTSGSLNGYLGEVIFFDKALDTDDIAWLKDRYDNNLPFI